MVGVMPALLSALGFDKISQTLFRPQKMKIGAMVSKPGLSVNAVCIMTLAMGVAVVATKLNRHVNNFRGFFIMGNKVAVIVLATIGSL